MYVRTYVPQRFLKLPDGEVGDDLIYSRQQTVDGIETHLVISPASRYMSNLSHQYQTC